MSAATAGWREGACGGLLFILEGIQRQQRRNVEAMQLILNCQRADLRCCHARNETLEQLCHDGVSMDGMKPDGLHPDALQGPGLRCRQVDLSGSSQREADLRWPTSARRACGMPRLLRCGSARRRPQRSRPHRDDP